MDVLSSGVWLDDLRIFSNDVFSVSCLLFGIGSSSYFGGKTNGSFFLTKNSSEFLLFFPLKPHPPARDQSPKNHAIKKLDVILTEENLSKAIGRRGQNVRLATKLLNYEINIMTDQEDSERRQLEFKEKTDNFVKNLELDETLGQLLVAEGFSTIDDIKDSKIEDLTKIEGIEEDTAKELIERSKEFHKKDLEEISKKIKDLGLENNLINHEGLTPGMLVTLGEQKILTLNDFADLASDELTGSYDVVKGERIKIKGYLEDFALSKKEADELIMSARNKIYPDWEMKNGKKKIKVIYIKEFKKNYK